MWRHAGVVVTALGFPLDGTEIGGPENFLTSDTQHKNSPISIY